MAARQSQAISHMHDLTTTSATEWARRIRARSVSSVEVVQAHLRRIDEVNPEINAVVQLVAESALEDARLADADLAKGESRGPLHGVPFTVKDIFDTADVISAVGVEDRASFIPERDAVVVTRMKSAGAILLGKTNCPAKGDGLESVNDVYGRTNHPLDPERTPGGSSGGEAAIIAAGGSPLGLGSDSGGSIRLPAHYCGIAGLKPTSGRIPNTGAFGHRGGLTDPCAQVGPLARFVDDLGLALPVLCGPDWRDSGVVPMPLGGIDIHVHRLKVAFYADDGTKSPTPETIDAIRSVAQSLAGAGLVVEESRPEPIGEFVIDTARRFFSRGSVPRGGYHRLMADWDEFRTKMLTFIERFDVILCPVCAVPAVPHDQLDENFNYTIPYNLTGWPAATVRAGTSPDGMPIGIQIVGRPWCEDVVLAVARLIESQVGFGPL